MERTLVFDLGDVLVSSSTVLPALAAELGVGDEDFAAAYWPGRPAHDRGGPAPEYWTGVLAALGRAPEPGAVAHLTELDSALWSRLPQGSSALLDGLVADGVRLALLSNAPAPLAAAVRAAPWSAVFAHLLFSADVGMVKPEQAIYARADEVYGTAGGTVVFLDDRADNVAAARAHGWDAHVWVDAATAAAVLATR